MNKETCNFSGLVEVRNEYFFVAKDLIKGLNQALGGSSFREDRIRILLDRLKRVKSKVAHCDNSIQVLLLENEFLFEIKQSLALSADIEKAISQAETLLDYLSDEVLYGKFNGELVEWFRFWESFEREIHSREDLSPKFKLFCLKRRLESWPLDVLTESKIEDHEYEKAIRLLQAKFSNIDLLIETHLNALIDLEPPTATPVSLLQFSSNFNYHIRALKAFRTSIEDASILIAAILNKKLPKEIWDRINKADQRSYWTFPDFENALNFEILTQCSEIFEKSSKIFSDEIQSLSNSTSKDLLSEFQSIECQFCLGRHDFHNCTIYGSAAEKMERANQLKFCLVCFEFKHESEDCLKNGCFVCNKSHNKIVCVVAEEKKQSSKNGKIKVAKKKKKICPLCIWNHNAKYCFIYKTAKTKLVRAKRINLCLLCLSHLHVTEKCTRTSLYLCKFCKGKHNVIFCVPGYEERLIRSERLRKLVMTSSSNLKLKETPSSDIKDNQK